MSELMIILNVDKSYTFVMNFVGQLCSTSSSSSSSMNYKFKYEILILNDFSVHGNDGNDNDNDDIDLIENNIEQLIQKYDCKIWNNINFEQLNTNQRLLSDLNVSKMNIESICFVYNFVDQLNHVYYHQNHHDHHHHHSQSILNEQKNSLRNVFKSIDDLLNQCSHIRFVDNIYFHIIIPVGLSGINVIDQFSDDNDHKNHDDDDDSNTIQILDLASYGNFIMIDYYKSPIKLKLFQKLFHDADNDNNNNRFKLHYNSNCKYYFYHQHNYKLSEIVHRHHNNDQSKNHSSLESSNLFIFKYRQFHYHHHYHDHQSKSFKHYLANNCLVEKFFNDIHTIISDNIDGNHKMNAFFIDTNNSGYHSSKSSLIKSNAPLELFILRIKLDDRIPQFCYRYMLKLIGKYLYESYIDDLLSDDNDLFINNIKFGYWIFDTDNIYNNVNHYEQLHHQNDRKILNLNLIVENCIKIKWNLNDTRILYSKYFHLIDINVNNSHDGDNNSGNNYDDNKNNDHDQTKNKSPQKNQYLIIPTCDSLYPKIFKHKFQFYWKIIDCNSSKNKDNNTDDNHYLSQNEFHSLVWNHFQPTNLLSIELLNTIKLFENFLLYSYQFQIQSIDLSLNQQKINQLLITLAICLLKKYPLNIRIHNQLLS